MGFKFAVQCTFRRTCLLDDADVEAPSRNVIHRAPLSAATAILYRYCTSYFRRALLLSNRIHGCLTKVRSAPEYLNRLCFRSSRAWPFSALLFGPNARRPIPRWRAWSDPAGRKLPRQDAVSRGRRRSTSRARSMQAPFGTAHAQRLPALSQPGQTCRASSPRR